MAGSNRQAPWPVLSSMKILVVGQGAIGLLWYAHLLEVAKHSDHISLLTSESDDKAISELSFTTRAQEQKTYPLIRATQKDIQAAQLILVCVKSYQVEQVIAQLNKDINEHADIILSHNGMGTFEELPTFFVRRHNIFTLLTTHGCKRTAPFQAIHTGTGVSDFGLLTPGKTSDFKRLIQRLNSALPEVYWHDSIKEKQWLKLAINCVINPITAIDNIENAGVLASKYQARITGILSELIALAGMENVILPDKADLLARVRLVAKNTAKNASSMRCDVLAGRQTEIDYINGYIHRLGQKHGIATPENTRMWQEVNGLTELKMSAGKP